jgi:glycosyltransferase involved in cell wall biosynthesis
MEKLYIVIPAYNEAENIENVIRQWYPIIEKIGNESQLVVFNDGSKDDTYERMKTLEKNRPLFIAETKNNSGHGPTCLYAYRYALKQDADYIFQTDSDGQTNPDEFWKFWEQRNNYDLLIGLRRQRKDGFSRILITTVLKIVLKIIFGVWVKDANTPFRLMKKDFLAEILQYIPEDAFLSNVIMSVLAVKKKQKIFWQPISFYSREKGTSFINMKRIFKIGIKAIRDFKTINKKIKL